MLSKDVHLKKFNKKLLLSKNFHINDTIDLIFLIQNHMKHEKVINSKYLTCIYNLHLWNSEK